MRLNDAMPSDRIEPLFCSHGVPFTECPDRDAHHAYPKPGEFTDEELAERFGFPGERTEPLSDSPAKCPRCTMVGRIENGRCRNCGWRSEPLSDSEWLAAHGLAFEVECERCRQTHESSDPTGIGDWMRDHDCTGSPRRTLAAMRVADYYTPDPKFGDGDERNRMAQALAVLAAEVRRLR
jgi:hypothetical protein